jgi:DNA-binding MarR family transcriptional regulator
MSAGPLGIFTDLALAGLLLGELQNECLEPVDLSFVDYSILRVLHYRPAPHELSPSKLSEAAVRSTGGMTKIIDRLERRGLVMRVPDPGDRRSVLVRLTDEGVELSNKASAAYTIGRERVLGRLSERQLAESRTAVRRLIRALDEDRQQADNRVGDTS